MSIFEERGLTPNIVFSSPSIEMVGRGFGFSILVTQPFSEYTYDGQKLVCIPLTKPVQLFVDYCREELARVLS